MIFLQAGKDEATSATVRGGRGGTGVFTFEDRLADVTRRCNKLASDYPTQKQLNCLYLGRDNQFIADSLVGTGKFHLVTTEEMDRYQAAAAASVSTSVADGTMPPEHKPINWGVYPSGALFLLVVGLIGYLIFRRAREVNDRQQRGLETPPPVIVPPHRTVTPGASADYATKEQLKALQEDLTRRLDQLHHLIANRMAVNSREERPAGSAYNETIGALGKARADVSSRGASQIPPSFYAPDENYLRHMLDRYNLLAAEPRQDGISRFQSEFRPVSVAFDREAAIFRPTEDDKLWCIIKDDWAGGVVVPGEDSLRYWHQVYVHMGGQKAKYLLESFYALAAGEELRVVEPARVRRDAGGDLRLANRGKLLGI